MRRAVLIGISAAAIGGCAVAPYSTPASDPDRRYLVSINDAPAYSYLGPAGRWETYGQQSHAGSLSFKWPIRQPVTFFFTSDLVRLDDAKTPSGRRWLARTELALAGKYKEAIDSRNNPEYRRHLEQDVKASGIYGKVIEVAHLICIETGWNSHMGPNPDPAVSGKWAGGGFYQKISRINCPLRKGHEIWVLHFFVRFSIGDTVALLDPVQQAMMSPAVVEQDIRAKVQRSLDSLEVYGFSQ